MRMSMVSVAAAAVLAATAGSTSAFDRETVDALKACHDHVWFDVPEFKDMPNAAVSVWPSSEDGGTYVVFWNVSWDEPKVRAAGSCTVVGGKITAEVAVARPAMPIHHIATLRVTATAIDASKSGAKPSNPAAKPGSGSR